MKSPYAVIVAMLWGLLALGWGSTTSSTYAYQPATPTARPTATNVGGSSGSDSKDEPVVAPAGNVRGFVYNYSAGGAPEAGMAVVLDGGGWQVETVTDSNGFYQFSGLGSSQATLNLRLPAGTTPLMPDWPIFTGSPLYEDVNLGFYWGQSSPLPVVLTAKPATARVPVNQVVAIQLEIYNRSGGVASNALLDIRLPKSLIALKADTVQGQIDFSEQRVWADFGTIADGATTVVTVQARFATATVPQDSSMRIIFTYDEQLVPQVVMPSFVAVASQKLPTATPIPESRSIALAGDSTENPATTPMPEPNVPAVDTESATESAVITVTPVPEPENQAMMSSGDDDNAEPESTTNDSTTEARDQSETLIPETGQNLQDQDQQPHWALFSLTIFLLASTGYAGYKTCFKPRV